jgi:xanthine dehydrogenase accessory factor
VARDLLPPPPDVFDELLRFRREGRPCVLATVVRTAGSTPRKGAARMLVDERGAIVGTIGGGRVEKEVIDACAALLGDGPAARPRLVRYHLTHELGMCCGGEMEVFCEPMVPEPPLVVCGAGHVAHALVPLARSVGFAPIVVDEPTDSGQEFASRERFPDAVELCDSFDVRDWTFPLDDRTYLVVVTRDHPTDQRLLEAVIGKDIAYLGLIGSRRKIEVFKQRLLAKGVDPARLERLHAPIGLDIGAQGPEEIAVSIVAELIQIRAARRRATLPSPKE